MTALVWDQLEDRRYETGVDRGVVYVCDNPGVVWNGLTEVNEVFADADRKELFYDGRKFSELIGPSIYQANIKAYSTPPEFRLCIGDYLFRPGITMTRQPRHRFSMTYRTLLEPGYYKLHLIYNAMIVQTNRSMATLGSSPRPTMFEGKIDVVPPVNGAYRPSAHITLDSSKVNPADLTSLEETLYGTGITDPEMPTQAEIVAIFGP